MWDHMQGYGVMGFGGIFGIIVWLLLVAGLIVGIVWLVSSSNTRDRGGPTALEILKRRYASGDITEEEYHRMKKELEGRG